MKVLPSIHTPKSCTHSSHSQGHTTFSFLIIYPYLGCQLLKIVRFFSFFFLKIKSFLFPLESDRSLHHEQKGGVVQCDNVREWEWNAAALCPGQEGWETSILRFGTGCCKEPTDICGLFVVWVSLCPFSTCQPGTLQPTSRWSDGRKMNNILWPSIDLLSLGTSQWSQLLGWNFYK